MHEQVDIEIDSDAIEGPRELFPRTREELVMWKLEFSAIDYEYISVLQDVYLEETEDLMLAHIYDWLMDLEQALPGAISKKAYSNLDGPDALAYQLIVSGVVLGVCYSCDYRDLFDLMERRQ